MYIMNEKIIATCWLKNNTEWFYPSKPIDLSLYDNLELISRSDSLQDLFYAWNTGYKDFGRLFKGTWNKGIV